MARASSFGAELKRWRALRRLSQLTLALDAGVSPRHLSFLETGRAHPSRDMIRRLGQALSLPLEAINGMMQAAGFTPAHAQSSLSDAHLSHARSAMERIVDRHDPYPGMALDREWRLVHANGGAAALLTPLGLGIGDSLIAPFRTPGFGATVIENWAEVGGHMLVRLATESRAAGGIEALDEVIACLMEDPQVVAHSAESGGPILATRYRLGDVGLAFFSTFMGFQNALDITLADLRVELMFPADDHTSALFEASRS